MELFAVMGGRTLYAERDTFEAAQRVLDEQRSRIEKFGRPHIVAKVVPFPTPLRSCPPRDLGQR